jgi:hypothetical protein
MNRVHEKQGDGRSNRPSRYRLGDGMNFVKNACHCGQITNNETGHDVSGPAQIPANEDERDGDGPYSGRQHRMSADDSEFQLVNLETADGISNLGSAHGHHAEGQQQEPPKSKWPVRDDEPDSARERDRQSHCGMARFSPHAGVRRRRPLSEARFVQAANTIDLIPLLPAVCRPLSTT